MSDHTKRATALVSEFLSARGWAGEFAADVLAKNPHDVKISGAEAIELVAAAMRAAPEGFVLVPVEPTEEMVDASLISVPIAKRINPGQHLRVYGARAWAAMLAARPQGVK